MTAPALHTDKLPRNRLPHKQKPDMFLCDWGLYNLSKYPDMPARWLAYQKAGIAYPGIDALLAALLTMLRLENERDLIPTGELTQPIPLLAASQNKPQIAPAPVLVSKKTIPEKRTGFTFSGLLQLAKEKPFFYVLAPEDWLVEFDAPGACELYWILRMYARTVTRVETDKVKVELFHTGAQGQRRLEIIAALRKWEAQRERQAA